MEQQPTHQPLAVAEAAVILIVDDNPDAAHLLFSLLTRLTYTCEMAYGGVEALAKIRAHPKDQPLLVILDDMMPDLGGLEVLRELRKDPEFDRLHVVIYSARLHAERRDEALALGAKAWILKGQDVNTTLNAFVEHYHQACEDHHDAR